MGNLTHYAGSGSGPLHAGSNNPGSPGETPDHVTAADGYASEDFVPGSSSSSRERKKGWIPYLKKDYFFFTGLEGYSGNCMLVFGNWLVVGMFFLVGVFTLVD